jgi:hypothetical protein
VGYSPDSNRCVPNVITQFDALKDHGEIMGFWDGGGRIAYPSLDTDYQHWQGIQRLAYPADHRILMILTSSSYSGGHYAVVSLGTRGAGGISGRRFGGDRMNDLTQDWNVPPHSNDVIIQNGKTSASPLYTHPGGIQTIGQFLAAPLEIIKGGGPFGRTQLFDAGVNINFNVTQCDGTTPGCIQTRWVFEHNQPGDGEVALAKLDDGRYLMINALATDTKVLEVNVSGRRLDGTPRYISDPIVFGAWNSPGSGGQPSAVFKMDHLGDWKPYQSLQLVTECASGQLFLVGMEKDGSEDWADLYRLNFALTGAVNREGEPLISTDSIKTAFRRVRHKHFWCTYRGSARQCDFDAATGVYVDPFGTFIVYASVHDDSGPGSGVTRFVEFSPNDPIDRPDTAALEPCDTTGKMWIELSNKPLSTGGVPPVGSDRFFVEYQNEARSHKSFSKAYDFDNRALSIRYCLPAGYRYKLCSETDFRGTCKLFCGSAATGCSGLVSGGQVRGLTFSHVTGRSGCFAKSDSPTCQ